MYMHQHQHQLLKAGAPGSDDDEDDDGGGVRKPPSARKVAEVWGALQQERARYEEEARAAADFFQNAAGLMVSHLKAALIEVRRRAGPGWLTGGLGGDWTGSQLICTCMHAVFISGR